MGVALQGRPVEVGNNGRDRDYLFGKLEYLRSQAENGIVPSDSDRRDVLGVSSRVGMFDLSRGLLGRYGRTAKYPR